MMSKKNASKSVAFVGMAHVGLVSCIAWASLGNSSLGLDTDEKLISGLGSGKLPIYEPGLDKLVEKNSKNIKSFFF